MNFSSLWFPVTCYGQFALPVCKELNAYKHIILWTSDKAHCHDLSPCSLQNTFCKHVCSDSNVFCQYYPEVFRDLRWKIQFNLKRSSVKVMIVYSLVCPVFDRLDFQPDKIYVFYDIMTSSPLFKRPRELKK